MTARPLGVLFVCYANIVRSPLAAAVFAHLARDRGLAARFRVDSAGVAADSGYPPHPGSVAIAAAHGVTLAGASRPLRRADLFDFDEILVLDRLVAAEIRRLSAGVTPGARLRLLATLAEPDARGDGLDVPDPMRGGPAGFDAAFAQISRACAALLDELTPRTGP